MTDAQKKIEAYKNAQRLRAVKTLIERIVKCHEDRGFSYNSARPEIREGLYGEKNPLTQIFTKVEFVPKELALYINLGPLDVARTGLQNALTFQSGTGRNTASLETIVSRYIATPASNLEINNMISVALGEFYLNCFLLREIPDSWLLKKTIKEHETFSRDFVCNGICQYFGKLFTPSSETISTDVWKRYSEDPELKKKGGVAHFWFMDKGAVSITSPILDTHKENGLRYLAKTPLRINRHFGLMPVPKYLENAMKALSANIA